MLRLILGVAIFALTLLVIMVRPYRLPEAVAACAGALLMLLGGIVSPGVALHALGAQWQPGSRSLWGRCSPWRPLVYFVMSRCDFNRACCTCAMYCYCARNTASDATSRPDAQTFRQRKLDGGERLARPPGDAHRLFRVRAGPWVRLRFYG
jgi:hypothetical protein